MSRKKKKKKKNKLPPQVGNGVPEERCVLYTVLVGDAVGKE